MEIIKVNDFYKAFSGKQVHMGVNLSILKGECLGLLGGSGAGKSVILRSLIGLEKPDHGQILVEGKDITSWNEDQLITIRKKVAYVFQNGALFDSMTVFDNLAYPLREHTNDSAQTIKNKIFDLLNEFGLSGNEFIYPSKLSGGMQKRVGLARSIILQPDIILYDEPTAGLDPHNTIKIQEMILRLKEKKVTSVFVTHDMPSALAVCDRIALLENGKIGAIGKIDDLRKGEGNILQRFMEGKVN